MQSIISLADRLALDFSEFRFVRGQEFHWDPSEKTIYFNPSTGELEALLHELSHALLGHHDFIRDIQLVEMERDAWEYAKRQLAPRYALPITDESIQDALDTYRDWLHARSTCPECSATGVQSRRYLYSCPACSVKWKVNDARLCALRRYTLT